MNKVDRERSISEASITEVRRLREENVRLRSLLTAHGIPISEAPISVNETPQVASVVPGVHKPEVGTAEQRIALFRSLFCGRDDVYAIRWESRRSIWIYAQGRSRLEIVSRVPKTKIARRLIV